MYSADPFSQLSQQTFAIHIELQQEIEEGESLTWFAWELLELFSHSFMRWPFAVHGQYVQSLVSISPNLEPKVYNTEVPYFSVFFAALSLHQLCA